MADDDAAIDDSLTSRCRTRLRETDSITASTSTGPMVPEGKYGECAALAVRRTAGLGLPRIGDMDDEAEAPALGGDDGDMLPSVGEAGLSSECCCVRKRKRFNEKEKKE